MTIDGMHFEVMLTEAEIEKIVARVAAELNRDFRGSYPLLCPVLTGSYRFFADLSKHFDFDGEVAFVSYNSYRGTTSSGHVEARLPFPAKAKGRKVIVVEDIIDTGLTMQQMLTDLKKIEPADIKVCTLFYKPDNCQHAVQPDYVGRTIGSEFVVGYGLDYEGEGRLLDAVYVRQ